MCRRIALMTLILLLGLSSTALATTYYVSPSGNDNNTGTSEGDAWQTIGKVNTVSFGDGDSILFEGGQTFSGSLLFDTGDGGTVASPLTIGSYGTGRATISSGSNDGLLVLNRAAFLVEDLNFVGSGLEDPAGGNGITFAVEQKGGLKLEYACVDDVEVSGYRWIGIAINGWNSKGGMSGFKDVRITNAVVHDNGDKGITSDTVFSDGEWPYRTYAHEDIYVANCRTYNHLGIASTGMHSGNGIVLSQSIGAVIEFCEAWNNGERNNAGGGPLGIWMWEMVNGTIQFCESHHNKTATNDGGGFDLDGGSQSSILQYNYSHDNYGCGYLVCQFEGARALTDCIVRYNISENDSLFIPQGAIDFWAPTTKDKIEDTLVYNNTVYVSADSLGPAYRAHSDFITGSSIHNNIFVTHGQPVVAIDFPSGGYSFQGNCYWASGETVEIDWGGTMYDSVAAWRTGEGQEMLGGSPVGFEMDPNLFNAGGGGTIGDPCLLWTLNDYRLKPGNALIGAGLDLQAEFGINPGTRDFYGTSIPVGADYDVGAHEFDASAAPVSKADSYLIKMNTTLNADAASGVLANDFAHEGTLSASLVSGAGSGSVNLNSDGSFSYTPNTDFEGIDSFTYKANDGTDDSNISVVTIDVRDPKPVANDDTYYTYQDTKLTVDADDGVLANDEPSGVLTATLVSNPGNGTLSYFNSDGSFEYTPGLAFQGADNFTYKANWSGDDSNVATVTINVTEAVPWKHVVNNSFELSKAGTQITEKTTDMLSVMAWTNTGGGYCGVEPIELRDNPGSHGTCFAYAQHSGGTGFYQITDHNIAADTRYTLLWDGDNIWQKNPTIITSFFYDDGNGHTEITSKSFSLTTGFISNTILWGEDVDLPMEFITPSSAAYIGEKLGVKFYFVDGGGSVYTAVDRVRLNVEPLELARTPSPADGAAYVATNATLSWLAGSGATSHDVYFGTDVTAVIGADTSSPEFKGNQTGTTYNPVMAADTTYYWRIDEVDGGTHTGEVWSFTTQGADHVANSDIAVTGLLSLDYTATQYSNNSYEWICEVESAGGPQTRYSYMEHKWTFNIPSGGETVTFYVEAFRTENEDNDDFVFAYSTDDVIYTDMVTVTKTSDDDAYQSYGLPGDTSGTVYVRALDTDRTAGNAKLDRIYVDHMYIRAGIGGPTPTPTPTPTATPTPTPTATPTPTPTPTATPMYVYDITMSSYEPKANYYAARATVWIKDVSLNDISGATVTGEWSGATTSGDTEGITGGDGKVTLESKAVKGGGTYTFCVTDVSATGYTYEPSLNNETCDSITAP